MAKYHKFVFDEDNRKFLGKFEEMYQAETNEGFDSWHQEDLRSLSNQICLALVNRYNFNNILDIGCGKGTFAHLCKKTNNRVVGIDISETAVKIARAKFPDNEFIQVDLAKDAFKALPFYQDHYDLTIFMEVLSYLPDWREVLRDFAAISHHALVSLYIPKDPIGFVNSRDELLKEFQSYFRLIEDIHLITRQKTILFGKRSPGPEKEK